MGKMYEVDGQVFAEAEVANRLMLLTEGDSLIQVDFDKFNPLDRTVSSNHSKKLTMCL